MWISEKLRRRTGPGTTAELGETTTGGKSAAVIAAGESRDLVRITPGGYHWLPKSGQNVLLVSCVQGERALCGVAEEFGVGLEPGEVYITSDGGAFIHLKNDGSLCLGGRVGVEGTLAVNGIPVALEGGE